MDAVDQPLICHFKAEAQFILLHTYKFRFNF